MLARLLRALTQEVRTVEGVVEGSVVVIDNGPSDATARLVNELAAQTSVDIGYEREPKPGIPAARNASLRAAAAADAVIFLDDDEWPAVGWLAAMVETWRESGADIVLGPAQGVLPEGASRWAVRSGVFTKDRGLPTGAPIRTAYSYNTLISASVVDELGPCFDDVFRHTGSSDRHYFTLATRRGFRSVWCSEALVYEEIPPSRVRLGWVMRRGFRTGGGAAVTHRLLLGRVVALPRVAVLVVANLAYGTLNLVGSLHPRLHWVEGVRRLAIAAGLSAAVFGVSYAEYRNRDSTKR